jgi:hypothetical protein
VEGGGPLAFTGEYRANASKARSQKFEKTLVIYAFRVLLKSALVFRDGFLLGGQLRPRIFSHFFDRVGFNSS